MRRKLFIGINLAAILALSSIIGIVYASSVVDGKDTGSNVEQSVPMQSEQASDSESKSAVGDDTNAATKTSVNVAKSTDDSNDSSNDSDTVDATPVKPKLVYCNYENCYKTKKHYHDGVRYRGHHNEDGHNYHRYCDVEDCPRIDEHNHKNPVPKEQNPNNCYNSPNGPNGNNGGGGHHGGGHHH